MSLVFNVFSQINIHLAMSWTLNTLRTVQQLDSKELGIWYLATDKQWASSKFGI